MLIALNITVLLTLIVLLLVEEWRHLRMKSTNEETRAALLAMAHELRSPLANVKKFNSFLLSRQFGKLTFAQQEIMGKIHLSLSESLVGIDRLLARAHLEEAMVSDRPSILNVRESIDAALAAIRPSADKKYLAMDIQGGEDAVVFGDILLLHGIFNEVLLNAIGYTPPKGAISVRVQEQSDDVVVTVSDDGIGIPDGEQAYVFHKFFRGEQARMLAPGNGLGLWFVQESLHKIGGEISFTPRRERGTTFTIRLPKPKKETVTT